MQEDDKWYFLEYCYLYMIKFTAIQDSAEIMLRDAAVV